MVGPMGESTEVASAKRAVLGVTMDSPDEELVEVLERAVICGPFFSSMKICGGLGRPVSTFFGIVVLKSLLGAFDMLFDRGCDISERWPTADGYSTQCTESEWQ